MLSDLWRQHLIVGCLGISEAIAFYNGGEREERIAASRLMSLVDIARLRIFWSAALELWTTYYTWATFLVPSVLTAPRYFRGEIEFGVITQVRRLLTLKSSAR